MGAVALPRCPWLYRTFLPAPEPGDFLIHGLRGGWMLSCGPARDWKGSSSSFPTPQVGRRLGGVSPGELTCLSSEQVLACHSSLTGLAHTCPSLPVPSEGPLVCWGRHFSSEEQTLSAYCVPGPLPGVGSAQRGRGGSPIRRPVLLKRG